MIDTIPIHPYHTQSIPSTVGTDDNYFSYSQYQHEPSFRKFQMFLTQYGIITKHNCKIS